MQTHSPSLKIVGGVNLALWPLSEQITSKPPGETPVISKRRFSIRQLFFMVFVLVAFFYHSASGYSATMQDVENFLAANPAPEGCNNWTETITSASSEVVKVWLRCAGDAIAYSENYWGGSTPNPYASPCHTYACDGSGSTLSHNYWWTGACLDPPVNAVVMDSYWSVMHYCDGRVETTPVQSVNTCWGGDVGLGCTHIASSPCLFSTIGTQDINSPQCRSHDTLLAEFSITCDLKITGFTASRTIIDPSIGESVTFSGAMSETTGQSVSWTMTIKDSSDATLRTFSGSGTSASVTWDGKYSSGSLADDGNYTAVLEAKTEDGECFQTATAQVVVKSSCVVGAIDISRDWVAPQNTGAVPDITQAEISVFLGKPAPSTGCIFHLSVEPVDYTGGHAHAGNRPTGGLSSEVLIITYGEQEGSPVTYTSGNVAGTERIKVSLVDSDGVERSQDELSIDVKVDGLTPLSGTANLLACGETDMHTAGNNNYGTSDALKAVKTAVAKYAQEYHALYRAADISLAVIDMSLPSGGLFDINGRWQPPHALHRVGKSVDFSSYYMDRCRNSIEVIFYNPDGSIFETTSLINDDKLDEAFAGQQCIRKEKNLGLIHYECNK